MNNCKRLLITINTARPHTTQPLTGLDAWRLYMAGVLQGVIYVEKPLDQALSFAISVKATDNWNGTTGNRRVTRVTVRLENCRFSADILCGRLFDL